MGNASATTAGTDLNIDVGGQIVSFAVPSGTTWANCAALAHAALGTLGTDLAYVPSVNSATVTLTDRHASAITDDMPIRVWASNPAWGGAVSMGTLTLATTASGAGSVTLSDGVNTASYTFANGDLVAAITLATATAINASTGYRAAVDAGNAGVVTLYYRDDRYARRLSASITAAVGTTATLAAGTAGSGTLSLSSALTSLAGESTAYRAWALAQADVTALGAVAAHLISQDAPPVEKGQIAFSCISTALPGTSLIGATTPALSTTELAIVLHAQAATVPAAQIAARVAVQVAAEGNGDHGRNYNGLRLNGSDGMPLAAAHKSDRSGRDVWNAGISAGYAPVTVDDSGRWYVVSARTTWGGASPRTAKLRKWSGALLPIFFRSDLRQHLAGIFFPPGNGRSLKGKGKPHGDRAVSPAGVKSEVLVKIAEWDNLDYFDGVEGIASMIRVEVVGGRVKAAVPFRSVTDLDNVDIEGYPA